MVRDKKNYGYRISKRTNAREMPITSWPQGRKMKKSLETVH